MDLLVIRHAIAVEREEFEGDDDARPLTDEGRRKMQAAARGIHALVPGVGLLASSNLLRARQTAEIVAAQYGNLTVQETETLRPETPPSSCAKWLASLGAPEVVAVVGHEPHLSVFVSWLVAGQEQSRVELKKGGACL